MDLVKMTVAGLVGMLVGLSGGLTVGYAVWSEEAFQVTALREELDKVRSWLHDEIAWADERYDKMAAALTKAQTELTQTRAELTRTRALVEQSMGPARSERLQAHEPADGSRQTSTR